MKFNKILFNTSQDALEADLTFALFINAIYLDALKNPHKLLDDKDVWDPEIVELLKDVDPDC